MTFIFQEMSEHLVPGDYCVFLRVMLLELQTDIGRCACSNLQKVSSLKMHK